MTLKDVIEIYIKAEQAGIRFWIDGGWAVDALLGKQTRPHDDLDIILEKTSVPKLRKLLEDKGYKDVPRDDTSPWNFVMGDDQGRAIDFHAVVFDNAGNVRYGPQEKGVTYPVDFLTGTGAIDGQTVRCVAAEYMVKFITPWLHKHKEKYLNNMTALCDKYQIEYPKELMELKNT